MHRKAMMMARAALVVKEAAIDESAEMQVRIVGRKAGLISWLLSLLGIDPTFTLCVYRDRIESTEGSLSGMLKTTIPLSAIDSYTSGFAKPFLLFVMGVVFLILAYMFGGIVRELGIFIFIVSIVWFVMYAIQKSLVLDFTTKGGNGIFFLFKRSVIEGVAVDEAFAERVGDIVKRNYIEQTRR